MISDQEAVAKLEDDLQRMFEEAFERKRDRFASAGLTVRVDPLARAGDRGMYSSSVEATVSGPDGLPCDIAFSHIVYQAKIVIDLETFRSWVEQITDDLIRENGPAGNA